MEKGNVDRNSKVNESVSFSDMRISNLGFGKDEYKTSKPNILKNEAVVQEILNISEAAESAIGHTIGPYADATLIQTFADRDVPVYHTRDGYTIMKNMKYTQPIPNAIFKIIKETSEYMDLNIGDSTSSGIPIQNALLKKYVELFNDTTKGQWKYSPVGLKNLTAICIQEIIKGFKDNPKYQFVFPKVNEAGVYDKKEDEDAVIKWLTKVATISANNDYEIGAKIAELYRNKLDGNGHVIACVSPTEEEYVEDTNAYVIPCGLFDQARMANSADHFVWEANNPRIAMFDGNLEESDLPGLKKIVETVAFDMKAPLFFTCSQINHKVGQYLRQCIDGTFYNELGQEIGSEGADPSAAPKKIEIAGIILRKKEVLETFRFEDVVLMTGTKPFATEMSKLVEYSDDRETRLKQLEGMLGTCEMVSAGYAETLFIGCHPNQEEFIARVKDLREQAERVKKVRNHIMDFNYNDIIDRLNNLQSKTTYYYCGGRTETNRYSRRLIIEDATKSVASTIKNGGVSIGGNISVCHYINHNFGELVENILEIVGNLRVNITAAENMGSLREIVNAILEAIQFAFGGGYRYALYNMYRDPKKTMTKWSECVDCSKPSIYNIMTNSIEEFDLDPDKCTTLIVPRETDVALLKIISENIGELINIGNMITLMPPTLDLEQLQLEQLKSGAAYMASNSVIRQ